jgi:hypothetical protein
VTIEVVLLALASTIRPTSLAAIFALLSTDSPRRLMTAYIAAGLSFTIAFGVLVVGVFGGIDIQAGSGHTKAIAEIIGGTVALAFAALLLTGRIAGPHADDAPDVPGRWSRLQEHHLTLRSAALAGPATHIPGLFYLIALNVIVASEPKVARGLLALLVFNAVWFALPIAARAMCIVNPAAARDTVKAIAEWTRRHARAILLLVSLGVGVELVVRGALTV